MVEHVLITEQSTRVPVRKEAAMAVCARVTVAGWRQYRVKGSGYKVAGTGECHRQKAMDVCC